MSFEEILRSKLIYSASFRKVLKLYKNHIILSISDNQDIKNLERFYWDAKKEKKCSCKMIEQYFKQHK